MPVLFSDILRFQELRTLSPELEEAWDQGRTNLLRATHSAPLPSVALMATCNGFYQLADAATGIARRFGVFVADHFADVGPRCLAIDVSHFVTLRNEAADKYYGLGVFFALAYSSTLCRADVETGAVIELATFDARPSSVFANGDHLVAADGTGEVALWRTSTPAIEALWRRKRISNGAGDISTLCVTKDAVIAGCADFTVKILSLADGTLVASLLSEGCATIVGLASLSPYATDIAVVTSRGLLTVWKPHNGLPPGTETQWSVRYVEPTFPATTLSSGSGWVVIGGANGQLALYATTPDARHANSETQRTAEHGKLAIACMYDLNASVLDAYIANDDHLCVVTASGDLFRWALPEVTCRDAFEMEGDGMLEEPRAELPVPDGTTHLDRSFAALLDSKHSANTSGQHVTPNNHLASVPDDEEGRETEDDSIQEDDSASNAAAQVNGQNEPIAEDGTADRLNRSPGNVIVVDMDVPTPPDGCLTEVTASSTRPGTAAGALPAGLRWPLLDPPLPPQQRRTWASSEMPSSVMMNAGDDRTSRSSIPQVPLHPVAVVDQSADPEADHRGPPLPTPSPPRPDVDTVALQQRVLSLYSPPAAIPGLRQGRRMDPRAAHLAVEQASRNPSNAGDLARIHDDNTSAMIRSSLVTATQELAALDASSLQVLDTRKRLSVPKEALDRFINEHQSTVTALECRFPIAPFMKFGQSDVLFSGVGLTSPLRRTASPKSKILDEYAPATVEVPIARRRDPVFERQRQVPPPRPDDHLCDDLLYKPNSPSIFFDVVNSDLPSHVAAEDPFPLPQLPGAGPRTVRRFDLLPLGDAW